MAIVCSDIPLSIYKVLRYYADSGWIDINNFIVDSVNNHVDYISPNYSMADESVDFTGMYPLKIEVPVGFAFDISFYCKRRGISTSKIITDALGHSLAYLLAEYEALEENTLKKQEKEMNNNKIIRTKLKQIGTNTRKRYKADVGRMGIKSNDFKGFPERTILLKNIVDVDTGEIITDHIWFTVHKTLKQLNLKEGDEITFNARVETYYKGYIDKTMDFKLNRMTKIEVKRSSRKLADGEITSATEPSFSELWLARNRAVIRKTLEQAIKEKEEKAVTYVAATNTEVQKDVVKTIGGAK